MSARGTDSQWTAPPAFVHPTYSHDEQSQQQQPQHPYNGASSVGSSPRAGSFSTASIANQSYASHTSYSSSIDGHKPSGLQTPSPEQPLHHSSSGYPYAVSPYHQPSPHGYGTMNPPQPYMDVHQPHPPPPPGPGSSLAQYSNYGQPQSLQQAASHYPSSYPPPPYSGYSTMPPMTPSHHVTSSMGGPLLQPVSLPPNMSAQPPPPQPPHVQGQAYDTTGQVAPPGMKPRVTATLWEDEGSLCFQVEANGVCVARREDNHMINGTKLLNVAGMTRGRRDGILKSEKTRHVVKIGPMHLKGVW